MRIDSITPSDPYASLISTINTLGVHNVNMLNSINQSRPILQAQPSSLFPGGILTNSEAHISNSGQLTSADDILYMAALALTLPKAFTAQTVTSSAPSIATASAMGVLPGNYTVQVTQLAQAQTLISSAQVGSRSPIGSGAATLNFVFSNGLPTRSIALGSGDNNLAAISSAINRAHFGISASVLTTSAGAQLQLTGHTGAINSFSVNASGNTALAQLLNTTSGGGLTQSAAALDARGLMNGIAFSSSTNAVFTATPGLALNLAGVGSATLNVAPPSVNIHGVRSFIKAFNHLLTVLQQFEENIPRFDQSPFSLMTSLGNIFSQNQSVLAGIGITSDQNFSLSLNRDLFQAALSANPTAVAQTFSNHGTGIAEQILTLIQSSLLTLSQQQFDASNDRHEINEYEGESDRHEIREYEREQGRGRNNER